MCTLISIKSAIGFSFLEGAVNREVWQPIHHYSKQTIPFRMFQMDVEVKPNEKRRGET